jgi:hypothetical protein
MDGSHHEIETSSIDGGAGQGVLLPMSAEDFPLHPLSRPATAQALKMGPNASPEAVERLEATCERQSEALLVVIDGVFGIESMGEDEMGAGNRLEVTAADFALNVIPPLLGTRVWSEFHVQPLPNNPARVRCHLHIPERRSACRARFGK